LLSQEPHHPPGAQTVLHFWRRALTGAFGSASPLNLAPYEFIANREVDKLPADTAMPAGGGMAALFRLVKSQ
jgi:hypothetical protein